MGNENIDQVESFTYLGSIIGKDGRSSESVKSRIAKAQGVFFTIKTEAKSSHGTCDKVGRAKSKELIWHMVLQKF